jgi:hypothetical protein
VSLTGRQLARRELAHAAPFLVPLIRARQQREIADANRRAQRAGRTRMDLVVEFASLRMACRDHRGSGPGDAP